MYLDQFLFGRYFSAITEIWASCPGYYQVGPMVSPSNPIAGCVGPTNRV